MSVQSRSAASFLAKALLILLMFGYVIKYLELRYFITNGVYLGDWLPEWQFINYVSLNDSIKVTVLCLLLLFPLILYFIRRNESAEVPYYATNAVFFIVLVMALGGLAIIRLRYGATMGQAEANLPWYLGTLVYRSQTDLMPGLLVMLIHGFRTSNRRLFMHLSIAALFILQALIAIGTGSKSGVIFFVFVMVCYWELVGDRRYLRPKVLVPLVLIALVAFIAGSQMRAYTLWGGDSEYVRYISDGRFLTLASELVVDIVNRFPGQEALALACGNGCSAATLSGVLPMSQLLSGEIATYYTRDVVGVVSEVDFRAPGFLGGAVMAVGIYRGVIVAFLAVASGLFLLRLMDRTGISIAAKVVAAFGLFRFFMEGAWYWADLLSVAYGVIGTELAVRLAVSITRRAGTASAPSVRATPA